MPEPLSAEEIAHAFEHLAAGCTRNACMIGASTNCYDRLMVTHGYRRSQPPTPAEFIAEFLGPCMLATIAAKDAEIAELKKSALEHFECIGELEYAKENAELLAKLRKEHAPTAAPVIRNSCNRHNDCKAADAAYIAKHGGTLPIPNFHCHDECCEDCFGS